MTDTEDKTNATGFYEHSFEISGLTLKSSLGNNAELGLELNLDAISLEDFPYYFLVEVFSKANSTGSNIRPFTYTKEFKFETKEQQNDPQPQLDTYTITLDPNGGTLNNTTIEYTAETEEFNLLTPTKTGYTFLGWTGTGLDNAQTQVTIVKGSTGNRTYTANWQQNAPDEYTLTIVADTGIASVDDSKAYQANKSIDLNYTLKDGYEFDKWSDSNGNEVTSPFTMPAEDVALTANAKAITYNLEYFLDGGFFETDNPKTYTVETENFDLNDPQKEGYTFLGWTSSETTAPLTPISIKKGSTGNKKFTANWSINSYNLTLKHYRGSGVNTVSGDGLHEYNSEVIASCTLAAGFEFDSWFDSEGNEMPDKFKMPAKDVELTANAKPISYAITYNSVENCTFTTANPTSYDITSASITLCNPTKTDYTFKGWSGTDLTGDDNTAVTIPQGSMGERTYTANFVDEYKITYNLSGGTTTNPATYSVLSGAIALTSPSRTGYEFIGWSGTDLTGDENTSVTIPQNATGNREYTANWKLILTLTIASDSSSVFEPVENNLYKFKPTFTITPVVADGVTLTDTQKANILSAIKVTDSTSTTLNSISKSWENGKIALSFNENLTASSTYTISSGDIDAVNLTCTPVSFTTICFSGSGTQDDPFLVATAEQLNMVRKYLKCHFKQTEDISLASFDNWEPIGKSDLNNRFEGSYDGDNKKITKLTINDQQLSYYGLFGYSIGLLKKINAEEFSINVEISGTNGRVGGICGSCLGSSLESCYVASSTIIMSGGRDVGGICGYCSYPLRYCHVASSSISMSGGKNVGGICGYSANDLTYCYVASSTISTNAYGGCIGGICGISNHNSIKFCYVASSTISVGEIGSIGGICGEFQGQTIDSCFVYLENQGKIRKEGGSAHLGLIVGYKESGNTVTDCFTNLTGDLCGYPHGSGSVSDTCYGGVSTFDVFKTKTWSDDKTYEGGSTVWSAYNTISGSSWPPDLTSNPRPQP